MKTTLTCAATATLIMSLWACAANVMANDAPPRGAKPKWPPTEAIEACKDKKDGDEVSFVTPRGDTLAATCRLIAVPAHPPKNPGDEPQDRQMGAAPAP